MFLEICAETDSYKLVKKSYKVRKILRYMCGTKKMTSQDNSSVIQWLWKCYNAEVASQSDNW